MERLRPQIRAVGDAALLISYGEVIDPQVSALVHALAGRLRRAAAADDGWQPPVAAYASLLVGFDPLRMSRADAALALAALADEVVDAGMPPSSEAILEIPVSYGGDDGPDLLEVARRSGLSPAEVVELHASVVYRAYFLGFAPGFAYLGRLPEALHLSRRGTPRQRVPAGSVAIAGEQTAVYPLSTAGGWHLLGRTELALWDVERDPPALIEAGQLVRFVALPD